MILTSYQTAARFLRANQAELEQDEAANNLFLGLVRRLRQFPQGSNPGFYLAAVRDQAGLAAAALITPPWKLVLQSSRPAFEPAIELIARELASRRPQLPGVFGPATPAQAFAAAWQRLTGESYQPETAQRLYQLTRISPPRPTPGYLRLATAADVDQLATWIESFYEEVSLGQEPVDAGQVARSRVAEQSLYLWEDGWPVCMAGKTRETARGVAINLVYTPPDFRGRGYASACVARLSQMLLDSGRQFCTLFTDLANPTSNFIYQRIGYEPVGDFAGYVFEKKGRASS